MTTTASKTATSFWGYIGNYGRNEPRGIALTRFDSTKPALTPAGNAAPASDPNFLILHPSAPVLYAVTSSKIADYPGAVEAFSINSRTGQLTLLNRQPSGGNNPCHLAVDPTAKILIVANYSGGTIAAYPLAPDGSINPSSQIVHHEGSSVHPKRQNKPYTHGIIFDHSGKNILVTDLGMDQILRYHVDVANGSVRQTGAATVPPGSGPRHAALAPSGRFFYVLNELIPSISLFPYSADGPMTELQNLNPWPRMDRYSGAEIEIHPSGKFLFASNRGHDTIAVCSIDQNNGQLTLVALEPTGGKTPRHFTLDPSANFLLVSNQDSNNIVTFRIDQNTGRLTPLPPETPADSPCCLAFVPVTS